MRCRGLKYLRFYSTVLYFVGISRARVALDGPEVYHSTYCKCCWRPLHDVLSCLKRPYIGT